MDSLTQAVLGAAVGQAVAGKALGRRAALWGAVAGTLPDLDVLAAPFLSEAGALRSHRGVTHGLAFSVVAGPAFGWATWRLARWRAGQASTRDRDGAPSPWATDAALRAWVAVWFWALLTHPLLDVFTVYGTQLLAPFSDRPFAVGSQFIIDPLYTVPLLACLVVSLTTRRTGWAVGGLVASTAVLLGGAAAQGHARTTVEAALAARGVEARRLLVAAGPLSSLVWRGAAEADGRLVPFSLHLADAPEDVAVEAPIPLATFPPEVARRDGASTLLWFSRGWLTPVEGGGAPAVADVRFGRAGLDAGDPFVFAWDVLDGGARIRQRPLRAGARADDLGRLWDRILHRPDGPAPAPGRTTGALTPDSPSP